MLEGHNRGTEINEVDDYNDKKRKIIGMNEI